jgi:hypothetical protein
MKNLLKHQTNCQGNSVTLELFFFLKKTLELLCQTMHIYLRLTIKKWFTDRGWLSKSFKCLRARSLNSMLGGRGKIEKTWVQIIVNEIYCKHKWRSMQICASRTVTALLALGNVKQLDFVCEFGGEGF